MRALISAHGGLAWAVVSSLSAACSAPDDDVIAETSEGASTTHATTPASSVSDAESTAAETTVAETTSTETTAATTGDAPLATDENLRVAFFGDHGLSLWSLANLQLIRAEQADFLVVLGDFDYDDAPPVWNNLLEMGLGADFPVFAAVGNHDVEAWDGYQQILRDRVNAIPGADCQGELGVQASCYYRGLFFLLSGVGTLGDGHEAFLESELAETDAIWKICAWHKNQNDMQLGEKGDEVGWGAYQACMNGGAIIATGHEHSYGRTMTLTELGDAAADHGAVGDPTLMEVGPGKTFVFVSGLGGASIRAYIPELHDDDTWWAAYYTDDRWLKTDGLVTDKYQAEGGVLFIDFHVDGDPYKARGYFKNVNGELIDEFEIHAAQP